MVPACDGSPKRNLNTVNEIAGDAVKAAACT
jgi:hypothetical protein